MKKSCICLLALMLVVVLLAGCAQSEDTKDQMTVADEVQPGMRASVIYYEDTDGHIVPVMQQIKWQENIAQEVLSQLIRSEESSAVLEDMDLRGVLPADTQLSVSIDDGLATVDIQSEQIKNVGKPREKNIITSVVNTLTEFDSIDKVQLQLNGKSDTMPNGTKIDKPFTKRPMNAENAKEEGSEAISLYYLNENSGFLVPVTRYVSGKKDAGVVINELLKDPNGAGLASVFPEGTKLIEYAVDDNGMLTLNFNNEFSSLSQFPEKETQAIKAIMLACKQVDGVKDVTICVEGEQYKSNTATTMAVPEFVNVLNTF